MDEKDWTIIEMLKSDSRTSNSKIARKMNVSEGTVRKRIEKLRKDGVIKKFTVILKGDGVEGLVLLKADPRKSKDLYESLSKQFEDIFEFTGRFDLAIRVNCKSIDELNSIVDQHR